MTQRSNFDWGIFYNDWEKRIKRELNLLDKELTLQLSRKKKITRNFNTGKNYISSSLNEYSTEVHRIVGKSVADQAYVASFNKFSSLKKCHTKYNSEVQWRKIRRLCHPQFHITAPQICRFCGLYQRYQKITNTIQFKLYTLYLWTIFVTNTSCHSRFN